MRYTKGEDFEFNGTFNENIPILKILSGRYEGVEYYYDNVLIADDGVGDVDAAVLSFNFKVIFDGGYTDEEFETIDFKTTIGDILMSLLDPSSEV